MTPLIITESRRICCCGAKTWTKFIACTELLFAVALFALRITMGQMGIIEYTYGEGVQDSQQHEDHVTSASQATIQEDLIYAAVFAHKILLYAIIDIVYSITFAVILFLGAHMGKPMLLLIWLIACSFSLICRLLFLAVEMYGVISDAKLFVILVFAIAFLLFILQIFFFHVVCVHRRELVVLKQQLDSIIHFNSFHVDVVKHNL